MTQAPIKTYRSYTAWSKSVRWFHWINVLSVISLIFVGLIMLYSKELGISSIEVKVSIKALHVIIGYIFATNLIIRIVFAFMGPSSARFSAFIPGKDFMQNLRGYLASLKAGKPQQFIGHNPMGKLAVSSLFLLLIIMAVSGLIRAGTDIYYPPFGSMVSTYIAEDGTDPSTLIPYNDKGVNKEKMASLKAFKSPFGKVHLYAAYLLMMLIVMHITSVVLAEVKEGGGLVSAMFSGKKILSDKPVDDD